MLDDVVKKIATRTHIQYDASLIKNHFHLKPISPLFEAFRFVISNPNMNRLAAASIVLFAFLLATSPSPIVTAFSAQQFPKLNLISQTHLNYRSMHHGPDVQPLTELEKLGASATKMDKDKIQRYGPGDFHQYTDDGSQDIFDGGDSEMGLSGDGYSGLKKIGRDVTPHMAKTSSSKTDQVVSSRIVSYTDELLESNPHMDIVRAQQLESWATQQEIARTNRYMDTRGELQQGWHLREYYQPCENEVSIIVLYTLCQSRSTTISNLPTLFITHRFMKSESVFDPLTQPGDEFEGIVSLRAPVNSVAAHEFAVSAHTDLTLHHHYSNILR